MSEQKLRCPYCRSERVLPFEEESGPVPNDTFLIIFISAFMLVGFYFLFVLLSYMSYPLMVILLVTVSSWLLNRKEKRKQKPGIIREKDFLCTDCGQEFRTQIEEKR
jgi:DNA-directed RNA polymerase subunit RPC12/RpoP